MPPAAIHDVTDMNLHQASPPLLHCLPVPLSALLQCATVRVTSYSELSYTLDAWQSNTWQFSHLVSISLGTRRLYLSVLTLLTLSALTSTTLADIVCQYCRSPQQRQRHHPPAGPLRPESIKEPQHESPGPPPPHRHLNPPQQRKIPPSEQPQLDTPCRMHLLM